MRMKSPQMAFMPQMAIGKSQLLVFLLREEKKKIPFKAVLDDPSVVIVDFVAPSADLAILAL